MKKIETTRIITYYKVKPIQSLKQLLRSKTLIQWFVFRRINSRIDSAFHQTRSWKLFQHVLEIIKLVTVDRNFFPCNRVDNTPDNYIRSQAQDDHSIGIKSIKV